MAIPLAFLATYVGAGMFNISESRIERSISDQSFEEKLWEGYNLLRGEPNAVDTLRLVQRLHYLEKDEKDKNAFPSEKKETDSLKMTKSYTETRQNNIHGIGGTIEQINEKNKVNAALFQGDILLTEEQVRDIMEDMKENKGYRKKRQAFRNGTDYRRMLWTSGVNYHFWNATPAAQRVFKRAAAIWSWDTCINFGESSAAKDRITVIRGGGCWSHIGKIGGPQRLSLGGGCESVGTAAHEIGHALGLYHTHARHDRDIYIKLRLENVRSGWENQFTKQTTRTNHNYGLAYDYGSVMHYGATRVSKNGKPYITPYDEKFLLTLGSPIISFYDRLMINLHYGCLDNCKGKPKATCQNDGYPHPRNCSMCICPRGYGGTYCDELPRGCGGKLEAKDHFQILNSTVGQHNYSPYSDNDKFYECYYWIQAPQGLAVEVRLDNYTINLETDGCVYAGVEINTLPDKRRTGYRFCSQKYIGTTLFSTHNVVPVITYSRVYRANTILSYRIARRSQPKKSQCDSQCSLLVQLGYCTSSFYDKERNKDICPGFCH